MNQKAYRFAWYPFLLIATSTAMAAGQEPAQEYNAVEAKKHIGEKATVVGKVECINSGRTYRLLTLDGCTSNSFSIVLPNDAPGPALNLNELKGKTIAVSGKIEGFQDMAQIAVTSTSQIVPRTPPNPNLSGANEKKQQGDVAESGGVSLTTLAEFSGNGATNKGSSPNGLILASDGYIYGTTERGGANNYGTVFKMTPAGALTTLIEFAGNAPTNSSGYPTAPVVEGNDGNFYGTTSGGGVNATGENNLDNGTIFKLSRSGVLTTLVRFSCDGASNKGCNPYSGVVQAPNGDFYGTTFSGGSKKAVPIPIPIPGFRGFGTIYKMSSAGQLTTLYDFSAHVAMRQGGAPWAGLILAKDGNFYGNTWGGLGVAGIVFKLTPKGAMTTLVRFSGSKQPKGGGCVAELIQASDGNFYGTTPIGGSGNRGTVFKMTPGGALTTLVEFADNDPKGVEPHAALVEGNDGDLYGTTTGGGAHGWGTIFQVTPAGACRTVWDFSNSSPTAKNNKGITAALIKDTEGNFYGTTKSGGSHDLGTVFKLVLHNSAARSSAAPVTPSTAFPTQTATAEQTGSSNQRDFDAAKQEYEQSSGDEAARVTYVNKLAQIMERNVVERWKTGKPNPDYLKIADAISAELRKHPVPKNSDPRKLSQLLIGQWQSPRHVYIFRRDGKYGVEDGEMNTPWRIQGNQIVMPGGNRTIILLNSEYLICAEGDGVFFHSRVEE